MKLDEQVTSLELSKKLKELGVKQESAFYWVITLTTDYHLSQYDGELPQVLKERNDCYSAFTVAELGDMLPYGYELFGKRLEFVKKGGIWTLYFEDDEIDNLYYEVEDKVEANARAKMLIYLITKEQ